MRLLDVCGLGVLTLALVGGCVQVVEPLADVDEGIDEGGGTGGSEGAGSTAWGASTGEYVGATVGSPPSVGGTGGWGATSGHSGSAPSTTGVAACIGTDPAGNPVPLEPGACDGSVPTPSCGIQVEGGYPVDPCVPSDPPGSATSQCGFDPWGTLHCSNLTSPGYTNEPPQPGFDLGGPCYFDAGRDDYVCDSTVDGSCFYHPNGDYQCEYEDGSGEGGGSGPVEETCVQNATTCEIHCGTLVSPPGAPPTAPPVSCPTPSIPDAGPPPDTAPDSGV